jgi:trimeric autotransporter adhesin
MKRLLLAFLLLGLSLFVGCGGSSGSSSTPPPTVTLTAIAVTPSTPSINVGATQQFTATGTYSDGTTKNLTASANWISVTSSVATINTSGLATAVAVGTSSITATSGAVVGSTTLTVANPLVSITVTPPTVTLPPVGQQQFTATGKYADGTTQNITSTVTWASSAPTVAAINPAGLAVAVAPGTTTISATLGTISGTATLTVTNPIVSIAVTPANPSIPVGINYQFAATATFFDKTTGDITSTATWTSSDPTVATVSSQTPTQGLATSIKAGTTTIQASSGGVNGSTTLTVNSATLSSIAVTPANDTLVLAYQQQYTATGTYSDSTTQNITDSVTWASSNASAATITTSGLATGVGVGSTTISAAKDGKTGSTNLTVSTPIPVSITITPNVSNALTLAPGTSQSLTATGTFSNGSTHNINSLVTWDSSNKIVATVSPSGQAKALTTGTSDVTATLNGVTGSLTLNVSSATLSTVTVTPLSPMIAPTTRLSFTATGAFSDLSSQTITNDCAWASGNIAVATMSGSTATGVSQGTANITATFIFDSTKLGSTALTVSNATLSSILVSPATALLAPSTTQGFSATGTFSDGSKQNVNNLVTWSTSDPTVVTITQSGFATGQKAGSAVITATDGSLTSTANVIVESSQVQSIVVTPPSATVPETISTNFVATGTFGNNTQNLTSFVTWASTPATVATISSTGQATGLSSVGSPAAITAVFGGVVGTASLTVTPATLLSIAVTPSSATVTKGSTQQFTATGTFSDSTTLNLTSQVTWSSGEVTTVVINSNGLATATGSGTTTVSAKLNGQTGSANVTVP